MTFDSYKTKSDFEKNCKCAFEIFKFIDNIDSNVRWFFKECYVINDNQYLVEFCSYDTPDYKDFKATISAIYNSQNQNYDIELTSKSEPF